MFYQEAVVWKRMDHPNIIPFCGVTLDPPQLVSSWMQGGDLTEYINKHPESNRFGLVSVFPCSRGFGTLTCSTVVRYC